MAAVLEEVITPAAPADEVEALDEALREVTRELVIADAARERLLRRRDELLMDVRERRRSRARTALDAFLPPVTFFHIEAVPPSESVPRPLTDADRRGVDAATRFAQFKGNVTMLDGQNIPTPFRKGSR